MLIGLAVFAMVAGFVSQAAAAVGSFTDDDTSIFETDIEWLASAGITKGCNPPDNTRFCPDQYVTRGQMAAFLVRALDYTDNGGGNLFTDDDGSIFEADIDRLGTAGVTKGCNPPDNTRFCPDQYVTRGQMAAFLVRALGYTDNGGGNLFTDDDSSIFENDIDRLGTAGVTKGCNPPDNTRFCPDQYVTRGQMAAFLHRALAATLPPPICRTQTAIPVDECATLADLYNDTHGTSWTDHTGWLVNPNPCTWQGVTCSAGHVTGLDLQNNHINGPLPDSIGSLTSLTNLYLNGNQLTGPIPPQVKDLSQLMYLILGNNELTGPIPAGLSTLPHLRSLVLHGNPLGGRIPAEFGNLPSLVYLGLTAAEFTGPIPAELGNIATLESLYLNSNHLSGPVPDSLRTGTAITTLALYAQDGCLTAAAPQPTNWLSTLDPDWNDGCNPVEPLVIPVIWVRSGQVGDPYSSSLSATGGVPPYTWRITSGALPAGLTFHPDGTIVGTPTHHATVSPTYEVEDSVGTVVSKQVGISIFVYPELCGTQTSIPELECVTLSFDVFDPTGG
ncbi:MAG: hypothetical protein DRJ50_07260, partial [Actinobacteria bacterium]